MDARKKASYRCLTTTTNRCKTQNSAFLNESHLSMRKIQTICFTDFLLQDKHRQYFVDVLFYVQISLFFNVYRFETLIATEKAIYNT